MIEVILFFTLLTIYIKLDFIKKFRNNRSPRFNIMIVLFSIALFIYSCYKIINDPKYVFGFDNQDINMRQIVLVIWIATFVTLQGFSLSNHYYRDYKDKKGVSGEKGNRGLRGSVGDDKICDIKECTKEICYKKIFEFCSKKYRKYLKNKGTILENSPSFNNKFLRTKMKKLCKSKQFIRMMKKQGSGKAYSYVYKIWDEWIKIILKYENGALFIENEYLNDNDFNNMITEADKIYAGFNNIETPGTPSSGKESAFDEIKKYDMWYWGESNAAMPKIIYKCEIEDKTNTLKKVESNHYYDLWESKHARQAYVNKGTLINGTCVKQNKYVPYLQKGSAKVSMYRPETLEINADLYYPLGDVIMTGTQNELAKKDSRENDPKIQDKLKTPGPIDKTVLVTGDTKHPIDFKQVFKSPRTIGEGIGIEGFSIWEPIPPKGYKCLGLVLDKSPNMVPPNPENFVCVPDKCVRPHKGTKTKIWENNSPIECLGDCGCDSETGTQDTDNNTPLTLYKSPEHIFKNNEKFYELIPEGEEGSCFDNAKKKEKDTSRWKVHSKNNIEYSIFNIYNTKDTKDEK